MRKWDQGEGADVITDLALHLVSNGPDSQVLMLIVWPGPSELRFPQGILSSSPLIINRVHWPSVLSAKPPVRPLATVNSWVPLRVFSP